MDSRVVIKNERTKIEVDYGWEKPHYLVKGWCQEVNEAKIYN